jgi:4-hydroxy-2-oxoheptanedioate aldolase
MPLRLKPTFKSILERRNTAGQSDALVGLWVASASPVAAEIVAGSGADLILVDGEHSPVGLDGLVPVLQALESYKSTTLVRVPWNDPVLIKQFLDAGAQNLIVPMVSTADQARAAVAAVTYPDLAAVDPADAREGVRGIGAALARASRWGRVPDYIARSRDLVSLTVQIETAEGARNASEIAAVPGVDAVFIGPADLAGSMGLATAPGAEAVQDAVIAAIEACREAGTFVGVNAFDPAVAARYRAAGADFVFVSADVTLLVKASDAAVAAARETGAAKTDTY